METKTINRSYVTIAKYVRKWILLHRLHKLINDEDLKSREKIINMQNKKITELQAET